MSTMVEDLLLFERYRCECYKFIAACYYLPDLEVLQDARLLAEALDIAAAKDLAHYLAEVDLIKEIEQLKIDFARLFVGPYELLAPPYGSVYLDGARQVMGDSTIDARDRYQQVGLKVSRHEVPDHIAIELEFMYYLAFRETRCISDDDIKGALDLLWCQKQFLHDHLGAWISAFASAVVTNAGTSFYRHLARVTESFVLEDIETIDRLLMPELKELADGRK